MNNNITNRLAKHIVGFLVCIVLLSVDVPAAGEPGGTPLTLASPTAEVLLIGDSQMMGSFGAFLAREMATVFAASTAKWYAVAGATLNAWLSLPTLRRLKLGYGNFMKPEGIAWVPVPDDHPDLPELLDANPETPLILALGSNDVPGACLSPDVPFTQQARMLGAKLDAETATQGMRRLCLWVGPPQFPANSHVIAGGCQRSRKSFARAVAALAKSAASAGCRFIDSSAFTYDDALARQWESADNGTPRRSRARAESRAGVATSAEGAPVLPMSETSRRRPCTDPRLAVLLPTSSDLSHFQPRQARYWARCAALTAISTAGAGSGATDKT